MASMAHLRSLQFATASINACLDPIWSLFLARSLNFSNADIGFVFGLAPLLSFAGSFVWPLLMTGERKQAAVQTSILGAFTVLAILPVMVQIRPELLTRNNTASLLAVYYFLNSGVGPWVDSTIIEQLASKKKDHLYGSVRAYLTLAIAVMAPLTGKLSDWRQERNFESAWLLFAVASISSAFLAARTPAERVGDVTKERNRTVKAENTETFAVHLFRNPALVALLALMTLSAISRTATMATLPVYTTKVLNQPPSTFGVMILLGTMSELPVFFFGDKVDKLISLKPKLIVATLMMLARASIHEIASRFNSTFLQKYVGQQHELAIMSAAELLQGASFALQWSAMVQIITKSAPSHLVNTYLSVASGLSWGLAIAIAQARIGTLLDQHGERSGFGFATTTAQYAVYILAGWWLLDGRRSKTVKLGKGEKAL